MYNDRSSLDLYIRVVLSFPHYIGSGTRREKKKV